jgi:hypothetical protein
MPAYVIVLHGSPVSEIWHPFRVRVISSLRIRGVSLRLTPGYGLASLRDKPSNENVRT